jgi:signal transduction histidine kinase/HAMP domain-containing protein
MMRIGLTAKVLAIVGVSFISTLAVSIVSIHQMSKMNEETHAIAKEFLPLNRVISQIILLQHEQNKVLTNVSRSIDNQYAFTKGYFLRARTDLENIALQIKDNLTQGKKLLQQENHTHFTNSYIGNVQYEMQYVEDILLQFSKNAYSVFSQPDSYVSKDVIAHISSLIDQQQFISDRLYRLENQLIQLTYESAQHVQHHEEAALAFIFWFSIGTFITSIGLALFLANSLISRPIRKILQFWRNMQEGNLNVDLDVYSNDEIGELARQSRSYLDTLCEKKAMEEEIQESYSRLAFAINSMRDGFVVYDKNDRLVMVNQAFLDFYDCIHDDVKPGITYEGLVRASLAKGMWNIGDWDPEDWVQSQLKNRSNDKFNFETEAHLADGRIMLRRERRDASGQIVGIRIDVTEMRRKEEELRQHKENLEEIVVERTAVIAEQTTQLEEALAAEQQLNEMQRQFVSMASHEFRTPLAIIDSSAQRLLRKKGKLTDEILSKRISIIMEAVQRMQSLMESTLSAAKVNAGKLTVQISDCDITRLIESVCSRQQEISHHHIIHFDELNLPKLIQADKAKVDQVLTNLLSNAIKYAPDAPNITVTAHHDETDVFLSVQDEGLGIGSDDLPNMFEQFFRAQTSTGIAGTGIGLHIVKQIIEHHGGEISVESEVGVGSTFTVRLPITGPLEKAA